MNHYSFHILDAEWGHVTFKLSGHPPLPAQIILNGHAYVDRQVRKAGILFANEGNCFTDISDPAAFARFADTLADESAIGRLAAVCRRWIYSTCVNCALDAKERVNSGFRYQYSVYQFEYSRSLIFRNGPAMERGWRRSSIEIAPDERGRAEDHHRKEIPAMRDEAEETQTLAGHGREAPIMM